MDTLLIEPTAQTPKIDFNSDTGVMYIKGRSIPDIADDFWGQILDWFELYLTNPNEETIFKINFEYFNVSSSKKVLALLYKLNELTNQNKKVSVKWHYRDGDENMFEVGQDLAYMIHVPFEFKAEQEKDFALAI